jgi:nucleotide-binding universal stress UspA family protein
MYELRRILVPTDLSPHADEAIEHAIELGRPQQAVLTLLVVDEFAVSPLGARKHLPPFVVPYQENLHAVLESELRLKVEALRDRGVRAEARVLPGRAYKVIVEEAERKAFDLVVIATRGQTHLSTHLIGGTTERVVRLSRQPVMTIRGPLDQDRKVTSVLCPTDLSPAGNVALSYALSIARQNGAKLYIQFVTNLEKPEREAEVKKRLPDLRQHHPQADRVDVEYVFDRDVDPSNSIVRFAEDRDVSVVVMSTHGRKGLRRVFIGNTAAEVVRASPRPVLTVTHPYHKEMFAAPLTEKIVVDLPGEESR